MQPSKRPKPQRHPAQATVAIEGMRFYAYHGYYAEEQLIGGYYVVDVYAQTNVQIAADHDELMATVNYETIYRIAKAEMQKNARLIENVAQRILDQIVTVCQTVQGIRVRVTKEHPPLGGQVAQAYVELEANFLVQCGRCKRPFLSHERGDGWTKHGSVYPKTRAMLEDQYGPNICKNCIQPHLIRERDD